MKCFPMLIVAITLFCLHGLASVPEAAFGMKYPASTCPIEAKPVGGEGGGDFTPFPWGNEIPIAQNALHGIWAPTSIACGTYFAFEVTKGARDKQRIVKVRQFDPTNCNILASGVGYELERVFYISMVGQDGLVFDMTIRAFNRKDLKCNTDVGDGNLADLPFSGDPFIVATLYPKREWSKKISYPLTKVSDTTRFVCENGDALPQSR